MRENIIVMVGGRSGVGKTSIIDFLVKNQGERYARPLSYTSRLKRNGEGCEEYNFISEEKMILMRDEGRFLNFDCVYGNYYAIAKKSIDVINTEGKVPIKEIHPSNQAKIKFSNDRTYLADKLNIECNIETLVGKIQLEIIAL